MDKEYKDRLKEAEKNLKEAEERTEELKKLSGELDKTGGQINDLLDEIDGTSKWELSEVLEYEALEENDTLIDLTIMGKAIYVVIDVGENEIYDDIILLAESTYHRVGNTLLKYKGWNTLVVDFIDIGEITLNRDAAETDSDGEERFPFTEVIGQLD